MPNQFLEFQNPYGVIVLGFKKVNIDGRESWTIAWKNGPFSSGDDRDAYVQALYEECYEVVHIVLPGQFCWIRVEGDNNSLRLYHVLPAGVSRRRHCTPCRIPDSPDHSLAPTCEFTVMCDCNGQWRSCCLGEEGDCCPGELCDNGDNGNQ